MNNINTILYLLQIWNVFSISRTNIFLKNELFPTNNTLLPSCQSKVFCDSDFLHDVQMSSIFPSSETFFFKQMKFTESEILNKYMKLKQSNNMQVPSNKILRSFIDENFENSDDIEKWTPTDTTETPSILYTIYDENYKQWAEILNKALNVLAYKIKYDVKIHPDKYSLIWLPNGFIKLNNTLRELDFWETYWVVKGLLLCDMKNTARGIIDNLVSMVSRFGFVPSGARVFNLSRSQPPMLILMVLNYYQDTKDFKYVKSILPELEIELKFWLENRMTTFLKNGKSYRMARYYAPSKGPRPEFYREDYIAAQTFQNEKDKDEFFLNIKSATESGWNFFKRWHTQLNARHLFKNITEIETSKIVPVDLNSILQVNALTLSKWFDMIGDNRKTIKYRAISLMLLKSIQEVMWNPEIGAWFDWDVMYNQSQNNFYASNIIPLWTESFRMPKKLVYTAVLNYLNNNNIIEESDYTINDYNIHVNMSFRLNSRDYLNVGSPLQAFVIEGFNQLGRPSAKDKAKKMAKVWLRNSYKLFFENREVSEGENSDDDEYDFLTGFDWTYGLALEFLKIWGDVATYE
ncbi:trehalase-like [Daktulosphaira vitifoliae]|uniref:trehalase-like n=1 Tax=Daktulosphaira vitifoliae TaxID=58002 RepID=UPI0021AAD1B5|nr:trehalase-like [Daktulosphaira vitifoliae]